MDETLVTIIIFIANISVSGFIGFLSATFTLGQYKNKVDTLENTVGRDEHGGLRKTVGDMRDKVVACETSLKERQPLLQRESPINLTERGQKFLKESGGERFVDENFDELYKKVEATKPGNAYDVQEASKEVIEELANDERLSEIKQFLFLDGSTIEEVTAVMGIYLRNRILKQKQWNVEDVDIQKGGG